MDTSWTERRPEVRGGQKKAAGGKNNALYTNIKPPN